MPEHKPEHKHFAFRKDQGVRRDRERDVEHKHSNQKAEGGFPANERPDRSE